VAHLRSARTQSWGRGCPSDGARRWGSALAAAAWGSGEGGRTDGQCVTEGGATGPRGATYTRGGQEASKAVACWAAATAGAVVQRERGRAARGGKAGA
jgi:hypothetical protein